ncbi:hypothetical protein PUR_10850 [Paenibacillus sp. URB8-2]|nr:hypothetical protein PUR_10850 [Paenibacillus sp. URB8-2]
MKPPPYKTSLRPAILALCRFWTFIPNISVHEKTFLREVKGFRGRLGEFGATVVNWR